MENLFIALLISLAIAFIGAHLLSNRKADASGTVIGVLYLTCFCSMLAASIISAALFTSFLSIPFKDTKIYFALSMFIFTCLYGFIIAKLFVYKGKGE